MNLVTHMTYHLNSINRIPHHLPTIRQPPSFVFCVLEDLRWHPLVCHSIGSKPTTPAQRSKAWVFCSILRASNFWYLPNPLNPFENFLQKDWWTTNAIPRLLGLSRAVIPRRKPKNTWVELWRLLEPQRSIFLDQSRYPSFQYKTLDITYIYIHRLCCVDMCFVCICVL